MEQAPTTPEKQRILRAPMIACIVLAVGVVVLGGASYPSPASSSDLASPTRPMEASYPLFGADDDHQDGLDGDLAVLGWALLAVPLMGRLLWPAYRQPKLTSIFSPSLERPG